VWPSATAVGTDPALLGVPRTLKGDTGPRMTRGFAHLGLAKSNAEINSDLPPAAWGLGP
jgi:hypothetical protein